MKQWVKKLVEQFEIDWGTNTKQETDTHLDMSEEKATLLFMIDTLSKNLIEFEKQPVRSTRKLLDEFARDLVKPGPSSDSVLFRFRQFFASYRIDEYSYIQNSFDDLKKIIWDFADQLSDDVEFEKIKDQEAKASLEQLREAVESNSMDVLRARSKDFINFYIEHQGKKDDRRIKRMTYVRKNLNSVKKKLLEATHTMQTDHLTGAFNRRSFDEQVKNHQRMFDISKSPVSLIILDIDHFKKINDAYGHDIGDSVIKECVRQVEEHFSRDVDFVARIGGEEFAVILPDYSSDAAAMKCEDLMAKIRKEALLTGNLDIRFTVSMGIAQLSEGESVDQWMKRADQALYHSKNTGRNKATVAGISKTEKAA